MKRIIWAAALVAALIGAVPAGAAEIDFRVCDGYPAPAGGGDGTNQVWLWGLIDDAQPKTVSHEENAIAACDRALVDPLLRPAFSMRRALLLRSKAVFQLTLDRSADALASLDQADAVATSLPVTPFIRQFALGNQLLRTYANYKVNRLEVARAGAAAIENERRYASWFTGTIYALRLTHEHDWAQLRAAMLARAATDPTAIDQVFWACFYYGDFAEALRLGPQISFALPQGRKDNRIKGIDAHPYKVITSRADHNGAMAYAFAAMGQPERAAATITHARAELDAARMPQPTRGGTADPAAVRADAQRRAMAAEEGGQKLDLWEAAIALRARAATLTAETLGTQVTATRANQLPVVLDLISQLKPTAASEQATVGRIRATLETRRDREVSDLVRFEFEALNRSLPRPGAAAGPALKAAGDGFVFGDSNGFYVKKEEGSPYLNIRYGNDIAPKSAIDDLTLLAAANYARKAGKDSFLVDGRMLVSRTIRTIHYYGGSTTSDNGAEVRLRILPINAAELTPAQEPMRWRLIRVQDVVDQLTPLYPAPVKR